MNEKNQSDLISVIIPFHSKLQGLLEGAVLSALNQSYSNIEVIVIDDFSPIYAEKELLSIKDTRLSIYRNDKNLNGGGG